MLILLYTVICGGALGISFLSVMDDRVVNNFFVRLVTLTVVSVSWHDPLLLVARLFEQQTKVPMWFAVALPIILMIPFFLTTIEILTGGSLAQKWQTAIADRFGTADFFPEADQAENTGDWFRAFEIYRDRYLPRQYLNPILWRRMGSALRRWNDPDRCLNELMQLVKGAADERARIEYALQCSEVLSTGIGSTGRAKKLLLAVLPVFQVEAHRIRIQARLNMLASLAEGSTGRLPPSPGASHSDDSWKG